MQNLNDAWTSGKNTFLFSKSYSRMSLFVSAAAAKKSFVVMSDAMPDGVSNPARPHGETSCDASSANTAYVLISPLPVSGYCPLDRQYVSSVSDDASAD